MPLDPKIRKVMIIGSGPIVIGQAAEFDFSGTQAARAMREEGILTVLVNSNPATIQTDPDTADRVYLEPLNAEVIEKVLERERVDGILSGMGGQTALNLCAELGERGTLDRLGVRLLGTQLAAIEASEDRALFAGAMRQIGEPIPKSATAGSVAEAKRIVREVIGGYPALVRPSFTLGGTGGGIARSEAELEDIAGRGLAYSRIHTVLIEESVLGWQEFEYEVMRDGADNAITVCNMENLDPMGIHTGESIVIAPSQTLSDYDHQRLRSAALKVIRHLKIEGGCNVQFALNPDTGEYRVIEVNPRVSRSSALASKVTAYPIARVAAKIAVGLRLDEIPNRVTGMTPASFEPALDYCVVKLPRWPFDKFRTADPHIGTQMKSTGEVMAIGRSVEEALLKAVASLDIDLKWLEPLRLDEIRLIEELLAPTDKRLWAIAEALRRGMAPGEVADLTKWNLFFVEKVRKIVELEAELAAAAPQVPPPLLARAKRTGFTNLALARITGRTESEVFEAVKASGARATFKMVDTCAAEFEAKTPYFYSTFEDEDETRASPKRKVLILGSGPIRIGQGIEFDYSCVHGVLACREEGFDALMVNNNPETVSTDYDVSTRLYFEPITLEHVLNILERERPEGVIVQFGGQTSVNLAVPLERELKRRGDLKTRILGTSPDSIDLAEDRRRFGKLMDEMGIPQPKGGTGFSFEEVKDLAKSIGYPVIVRPSYVLGGKAMEIVHTPEELEFYVSNAARISSEHPILVDKFLQDAVEVDVDAVCDGKDVFIGAVMEQLEEAGVHSGDSACVIPPQTLAQETQRTIEDYTRRIARALKVVGCVNLQMAVKDGTVYILEANPRASRTVPYVSKAIGIPLAKVATKVMLGKPLADFDLKKRGEHSVSVKVPVWPFQKLPGVDAILSPEMKSTGESMGWDRTFGVAYYKGLLAAGARLPLEGTVYLTVRDEDKPKLVPVAAKLAACGLTLCATKGTATHLREHGLKVETVFRVSERQAPDALDLMRRGQIRLIINTPTEGSGAKRDGAAMRRLAVDLGIPFITMMSAARAAAQAIEAAKAAPIEVRASFEYLDAPPREEPKGAFPRMAAR
ncbi:MAG TPA: carbamoyl-phosphate synthase large subunit [Candidatus Thermoplasmatota archaeon]|nr:carbamoyl-phosphate synthase large subunit [Candidatus Thermoplasmatota archaeon]